LDEIEFHQAKGTLSMNYRPTWLALIAASLLSILWLAHIADAQAPQPRAPRANLGTAFTYQGQLKNSGTPYTGACDFQFKLYDDASAGAQIGATQTTSSVSVSSGFFTTQIDFGTSAFNGNARWLDIGVRCPAGSGSYTTLTPRQAMTPAPYALALPGLYTQQNVVSPNLIGGYSGNIISNTVIGGTIGGGGYSGFPNRVWSNYATVGGGANNTAAGSYATIDGGSYNTAAITGYYSAIGGGANNSVSGSYAIVGGGFLNIASNSYAIVGGGVSNEATGVSSVVAGGGAVSCGAGCTFMTRNKASGDASSVGGGFGNTASGNYATVPGGANNSAVMPYAFAAGRRAKANHEGAFVWGDSTDLDIASTTNDQFVVRAHNGLVLTENAGNTQTVGMGEYYRDNAIIAWARVTAVGTHVDHYGIWGVLKSTGIYTVTLMATPSSANQVIPIAIAEVNNPPTSAAAARLVTVRQYLPNQFVVYITNGNYALVDNEFLLIVTGR
jgi:hypothetical protein